MVSLTREGSRSVWTAALICAGLGAVSAVLAFWSGAHVIESVLGALSLPFAAWAQMSSDHVNQRWVSICGAIAGAFGLGMGLGNGGFVP